jgi:hypothetical protein
MPPAHMRRRLPPAASTRTAARTAAADASFNARLTHAPAGHQRKLRVTANPNVTLSRAHVPPHCQRARTVLLGPLTQYELDAGSFLEYDGKQGSQFRFGGYLGWNLYTPYLCSSAVRALFPVKREGRCGHTTDVWNARSRQWLISYHDL